MELMILEAKHHKEFANSKGAFKLRMELMILVAKHHEKFANSKLLADLQNIELASSLI
jgi:hypothetical protein